MGDDTTFSRTPIAPELAAELTAEGWRLGGSDYHWWVDVHSNRSVNIAGYEWGNVTGVPPVKDAPTDPKAYGFVVSCHVHDGLGNLQDGHALWLDTLAEAIAWGRRIRAAILAEAPRPEPKQLTIDELLARVPA